MAANPQHVDLMTRCEAIRVDCILGVARERLEKKFAPCRSNPRGSRRRWVIPKPKWMTVSGKQTPSGGGGQRSDIGSGHDELL